MKKSAGYIRAHTHVDNLEGGQHSFIFDYTYDDKSKSVRSFGEDELSLIIADPALSVAERKMVGEAFRELRVSESQYALEQHKTTLTPTVLNPTLT